MCARVNRREWSGVCVCKGEQEGVKWRVVCVCKGEQEGVKWRVVIDITLLLVPGRLHQTSPPRSGLADRIAADRWGVFCTSLSHSFITANSLLVTTPCVQCTGLLQELHKRDTTSDSPDPVGQRTLGRTFPGYKLQPACGQSHAGRERGRDAINTAKQLRVRGQVYWYSPPAPPPCS